METSSVLKMIFSLETGNTITINVTNPKEQLTIADLEAGFAGTLVNENMLNVGGAQVVALKDAYYYNKEKTELE